MTSTFLNLLVLPTLALRYGGSAPGRGSGSPKAGRDHALAAFARYGYLAVFFGGFLESARLFRAG